MQFGTECRSSYNELTRNQGESKNSETEEYIQISNPGLQKMGAHMIKSANKPNGGTRAQYLEIDGKLKFFVHGWLSK